MALYPISIAMICLYNKQSHCHFGLKKMLNFVYFPLDDSHVLLVKMTASLVFTPKTSLTGKICDGTISHIVMISSVIRENLVLLTKREQFGP